MVLYGRSGCHLCDEARQIVAEECRVAGAEWSEVDIDTDPDLQSRYGEYVPVVTVDGVVQGYWRIDPERLHAALSD